MRSVTSFNVYPSHWVGTLPKGLRIHSSVYHQTDCLVPAEEDLIGCPFVCSVVQVLGSCTRVPVSSRIAGTSHVYLP